MSEAPAPRLVKAGPHTLNLLSEGSGKSEPLVLVHGFGGDLTSWYQNQPEFAKLRPTHAFDLPGHGLSSHTQGRGNVPVLADAVLALLDELRIERAHLVGHSLGGATALFVSIRHPDRVASAVLEAPGGLGPEINTTFLDDYLAADTPQAMRDALAYLFFDRSIISQLMVDLSLQLMRREGVRQALATIAAANFADHRQKGGMRDSLPGLKVPLAVVWGNQDDIIPVGQSEGLPSAIAVSRIDGAGHVPHLEKPQQFNAIVLGWLGKRR